MRAYGFILLTFNEKVVKLLQYYLSEKRHIMKQIKSKHIRRFMYGISLFILSLSLLAACGSKKPYVVTFDPNNGQNTFTVEVKKGEVVEKPKEEPYKDDYKFIYWEISGEGEFDFSKPIRKNTTLIASFRPLNKYTVTFNGYEEAKVVEVYEDKKVSLPTPPKRESDATSDWVLEGWYLDEALSERYDFREVVEKNFTLYPKFIKAYQVDFETFGGSPVKSRQVLENNQVKVPKNPEKQDHVFIHWYLADESEPFDFNSKIQEHTTLKAYFKEVRDYEVTFDPKSDDTLLTVTTKEGFVEYPYWIPEKELIDGKAFVFTGWYLENETEPFNFSNIIENDITLEARYVEMNSETHVAVHFFYNNDLQVKYEIIDKGSQVSKPDTISKEGFTFVRWYGENENEDFDFSKAITENTLITASWEAIMPTVEEKLEQAYESIIENLYLSYDRLNLMRTSPLHEARLTWFTDTSKYITSRGFILPINPSDTETTEANIRVRIAIDSEFIIKDITVPLFRSEEAYIDKEVATPFKNLSTEYEIEESSINLYFEEDGQVPYVNIVDFLELLKGFIDEKYKFDIWTTDTQQEITYRYYSESEKKTYHLTVAINAETNKITTTDPAFYWAYIKSTETNYGRNINYETNHPNNYYVEGMDVVYDLNLYDLSIVSYENQVLVPYFIANQLFAGSSYYNVYYNGDKLHGIYSVPDHGTDEYIEMKTSSVNDTLISNDMLIHNFNMLAFNLDYFYGLKDDLNINSFYDMLYDKRDSLINPSARGVDNTIFALLLQDIDEPHTSYGAPSYYTPVDWKGPEATSLSSFGPRFNRWYTEGFMAVDDAIEAKWGREGISSNAWAASSLSRPEYWFIDDTGILILDSFSTKDIEESGTYDKSNLQDLFNVEEELIPTIDGGSKYFFYNTSDLEEKKMEILVKGLEKDKVSSYANSLVSLGYEKKENEKHPYNDYYTKTINDVVYAVQVEYNDTYSLFYVGITTLTKELYTVNVKDLVKGDSAVYMELALDRMFKENSNLNHIILDITWNTGGNVGALYRVLGFITDEAFMVSSIDNETKGRSSTHVRIDNVPKYSKVKWSLLTSPLTFSAANSMSTIFKENNLGKIIGGRSGGGTSSITPIMLPTGTMFQMSSNNLSAYRTGLGTEDSPYEYHHNEYGITPDFLLPTDKLYDVESLKQIISNIK